MMINKVNIDSASPTPRLLFTPVLRLTLRSMIARADGRPGDGRSIMIAGPAVAVTSFRRGALSIDVKKLAGLMADALERQAELDADDCFGLEGSELAIATRAYKTAEAKAAFLRELLKAGDRAQAELMMVPGMASPDASDPAVALAMSVAVNTGEKWSDASGVITINAGGSATPRTGGA